MDLTGKQFSGTKC